jgi:hypothetical protein
VVEMDEIKPIYKNAVKVNLTDISIKVTKTEDNEILIERIRFKTDIGDITYKPKKDTENIQKIKGLKITETLKERYTLNEFLTEYPLIEIMNNDLENNPIEIVLSYAEFTKEYDNGEATYRFMRDYQFKTIYYEKFHKDIKTNLEKMQNWKLKQEEIQLDER